MLPIRLSVPAALLLAAATGWNGPSAAEILPKVTQSYLKLTDEDTDLIEDELDRLLDSGQEGRVSTWRNERSGNYGTLKLERVFRVDGARCGEVRQVIRLRHEEDPRVLRLNYCRIGNEWMLAE